MLNTNIKEYEKLTAEQVWAEIDPNYGIDAGSTVYRFASDENTVMISKTYYGLASDEWCCEIEGWEEYQGEKSWNMIGQGFGFTAEEALANAIIDCVGIEVLRDGEEDNCEDASNVITRDAYVFAFGDVSMVEMLADIENVNLLMGAACEFVKKNGEHYGIEWEEYRW